MSNGSDEEIPEEIPKVWSDLMWAIAERESLRKTLEIVGEPPEPPYNFHGFEVTAWVLGGMGMVLLGRDPKLDRKVALKLLQSSGPEADAALIAEAQTLAKLSHPNVVTVYAVSEWEGGVFFAMEHVDGMNGQDWLKRRPAWQEILDVFIDAGQGLAAAHDKGIQHGDFKPANMLIGTDGRTRVVDFGIADYLCVDDSGEQPKGRRAGTPEYMAPERLRGHRGDGRSDQYSFCASLWGGLHGSRPYHGKTAFELLDAIEAGAIQPRVPDARVPRWLTEVVRKGLAEDPDQRYRDMPELLRALKGGSDDETATDEPDDGDESIEHEGRVLHAPATPAGAALQRDRWPWITVGFVLAMIVMLGLNALMRSLTPEPPPVAEAVEIDPYGLIFAAIAADDFAEVERLWNEHKQGTTKKAGLTDAQSLQIAEACLNRAKDLEPTHAKAEDAAGAAYKIAKTVELFGSDAKVQARAEQIASDAWILRDMSSPKGADVRGLGHQAQRPSGHRTRGNLTLPAGRLFHAFGCGLIEAINGSIHVLRSVLAPAGVAPVRSTRREVSAVLQLRARAVAPAAEMVLHGAAIGRQHIAAETEVADARERLIADDRPG